MVSPKNADDPHVEESMVLISLSKTQRTPQKGTIFCLIALTISLMMEDVAQAAPTIRLMEYAICQQYYQPQRGMVDESLCRIEPIQTRLAHINGWQVCINAAPSSLRI